MSAGAKIRPNGLIIAIDGPSGAGKSTITRQLAQRLGYCYIDTGAMYRALALAVQRAGVDENDDEEVMKVCCQAELSFRNENAGSHIILNGEDVSDLIRTPEISLLTSRIAGKKSVRELLLAVQRSMGQQGGVILEGRDIGTVVFPDADLKFFLSASAEERGHRRFLELKEQGRQVDLAQTIAEVTARDSQDEGRAHAPLCRAEDAIVVDSTHISISEVVAVMAQVVKDRLKPMVPAFPLKS
jgi:cytidylate kinase